MFDGARRMIKNKEVVSWAREVLYDLLTIPTDSGNEEAGIMYLLNILRELGYTDIYLQAVSKNMRNLIVNPIKSPTLVIASHIDTIPILIKPEIIDDYTIVGTGACDAKGSIVSILLALREIEELPERVSIVILSDEEEGCSGSVKYVEEFKPKYAIVMEPTDLNIATSGYGGLEMNISLSLEYAHPNIDADEHGGELKRTITSFLEDFTRLLSSMKLTFSIFQIKAVSPGFIVPKECEIKVEIPIPPGVNPFNVYKALIKAFSSEDTKIEATEISFPFKTEDTIFMREIRRVYVNTYGKNPRFTKFPAWTDANNFALAGVKPIIFGPGTLNDAHSMREKISIKDIVDAAKFLIGTIKEIKID